MPLVKGKEITYTEKDAVAIQRQIDANVDLGADLKAEGVPLGSSGTSMYGGSEELQFGFKLFEKDDISLLERKTRYEYFREMDTMEFIHRALEIVADDGTQINKDGNVLEIFSEDEELKKIAEELLLKKLSLNDELWSIVYESCKMGDNFYEIVVNDYKKPKNIVRLRYLEPGRVQRIEKDGKLLYFEYTAKVKKDEIESKDAAIQATTNPSGQEEIIYKMQPWQIVHFKLENKEFNPYGGSLLNAGIKTYRRLSLLEDVMLIYRLSRAPERRVFYIDIGNLNKVDARRFLEKIKNTYRSQSFIDDDGKVSKKAHLLSVTQDIFVPVREGSQGTKIDTLQAGEALHNIDDMKYFRDKILRTMNIPPAYMGDGTDRSRGSLAQLDIKFSRFIERVQLQVIKGLNKLVALELFFNRMKKDDLGNFQIELTPPSNIKELTEIDLMNQKMGLLANIQQLEVFTNQWMLKNMLHFSDKEIADIELYKKLEQKEQPPEGAEGATPASTFTGGATETEVPPEGEVPAGEVEAPAPEEIAASTLTNILGRDFLVENSKDFFKLIKFIKNQNKIKNKVEPKSENNIMSEAFFQKVSEVLMLSRKEKFKVNTNNVRKLFIVNEMGGLDFGTTKRKPGVKVYVEDKKTNTLNESNGNGKVKKDKAFKEKKILLG